IMAGLPMNVISLLVLNIMMNSWAVPVYQLDVLEQAFRSPANLTLLSATAGPTASTAS
ncbi:hypothetical protein ElyMa_005974800, partial [Elysia marginata]